MIRKQQIEQVVQIVRPWHRKREFFEHRFEIFLDTLLAVKADNVMERGFVPVASLCYEVIVFGFGNPCAGALFHKEPFPENGSLSGTSHLLPASIPCFSEFAQQY